MAMAVDRLGFDAHRERAGIPALIGEIGSRIIRLVQTEVELAGAELASDLRAGRRALVAFALALVAGLLGAALLLVAVVLALAGVMPGWLAAVVVAVVVLALGAVAAYVGWRHCPRSALTLTRRSLKEDWAWLKSQL